VWSASRSSVEQAGHLCGVRATQVWNKHLFFCGENCKKMLIFATKKEVNEEAKHKTKFTNRRQHFSPKSVCLHTSTSNGRWTDCSTKKSLNLPRIYHPRIKAVPTPYQDRSNTAPLEANMTCPRTNSGGGQTARRFVFISFMQPHTTPFIK
jgi:hypothetical protein